MSSDIHIVFDVDGPLYKPHATPPRPYRDAEPALRELGRMGIYYSILTKGPMNRQLAKIMSLGVDMSQTTVRIVEDDEDKHRALSTLVTFYVPGCPQKLIVVGDRADAELKYGLMLGCTTIRILRGKYSADLDPLGYELHYRRYYRLENLLTLPVLVAQIRSEMQKMPK